MLGLKRGDAEIADDFAANSHIADNGRLLGFLETENLLENTIIYFLSDNGGDPRQENVSSHGVR